MNRGWGWWATLAFLPSPAWAAASAPAAIAQPSVTGGLVQMVSGLAIVLAAIAAVAWLVRRLNPLGQRPDGLIKIIATLAVSTKERLVMVEVQGEWLLLGVAPGRITTLHRMPRPQQMPGNDSPLANPTFLQTLIQHVKQSSSKP